MLIYNWLVSSTTFEDAPTLFSNSPVITLLTVTLFVMGSVAIVAWAWAIIECLYQGLWLWFLGLIIIPFIALPTYYLISAKQPINSSKL